MGELVIGLWQFCTEFIAHFLGIDGKRSAWVRLGLLLVSAVLAVGLTAIIWVVVAALIIIPKAIITG